MSRQSVVLKSFGTTHSFLTFLLIKIKNALNIVYRIQKTKKKAEFIMEKAKKKKNNGGNSYTKNS